MRPSLLSTVEIVGASIVGWLAPRGPLATAAADGTALTATIDWLERGATVAGASKGFALPRGWLPAEPDAAALLVPTLFDAARALDRPALSDRAEALGRGLLVAQLADGGLPADHGAPTARASVPTTGQAIAALLRTWKETGDPAFSQGAIKAGDFLIHAQHPDGAWRTNGIPQPDQARVAWALLLLAKAAHEFEPYKAAQSALAWVVHQQTPSGAFNLADDQPARTTSALAAAAQGLIEGYVHTGNDDCWRAGALSVDRLLDKFERDGRIAGRHDADLADAGRSEDVAGTAHVGLVALRMFQLRGDRRHRDRGLAAIAHAEDLVNVTHRNPGVRGGVPGSWPIFGRNQPMRYPAASAKFLADAALLAAATRAGDGVVLTERYGA